MNAASPLSRIVEIDYKLSSYTNMDQSDLTKI